MGIFRKIGTKMIISLLSTFLIVLGTFLVVVINQTKALADNKATKLVENAVENHSNKIGVAFNKVDSLLVGMKTAADQVEIIPLSSRRIFMDDLLEGVMRDETNNLIGAWASFEPDKLDGKDEEHQNTETTDATGRYATKVFFSRNDIAKTVLENYDIKGPGDYYLVAYESGQPYITDPYDYEIDGRKVSIISIAYPVRGQLGSVIGVIGVDYSLNGLNELNNEVQLFETGFGKLITEKYELVAHSDIAKIGSIDGDLADPHLGPAIMQKLQAGEIFIDKIHSPTLNTSSYKAFVSLDLGNSNKSWIYAVVVSEDEVMENANRMIAAVMIIGVIGLLLAAVIVIILARSISTPIKSMSEVTEKIAGGDLTESVPEKFKKQKDEIGDLARDIQKMRDGLFDTISGIANAIGIINGQMEAIHGAVGQLQNRIVDTSASTEELSAGMEETGASADELNKTAVEIEQEVEQISGKAEEGAEKSHEIQSRALELNKNITASIEGSNKVFKEIEKHLFVALTDSKAVEEINALADSILEITSQTTLLALNASIEAARAGEAGRGFAVVANEIGSLAEHSKNTVSQIQTVTKTVMNAVTSLSKSSNELLNFVSGDVLKEFEKMLEAAKSYTNDANYISNVSDELNSTSHRLKDSTQFVLKSIGEVAIAAQEGAKATNSIAIETSGVAGNISDISTNMDKASDKFDELTNMIKSFKI
ncbi:MAG: methyl-accepting chemotaxis protein [Lachnospiraceae bacterium]|nr:methyl-accepting chemotaxis protein [Lachnospiraceae bacterium]